MLNHAPINELRLPVTLLGNNTKKSHYSKRAIFAFFCSIVKEGSEAYHRKNPLKIMVTSGQRSFHLALVSCSMSDISVIKHRLTIICQDRYPHVADIISYQFRPPDYLSLGFLHYQLLLTKLDQVISPDDSIFIPLRRF